MLARKVKSKEVAEAIGCSTQTVHKWKTGGNIEHDLLLKLSAFLRKNWLKLLYGEKELSSVVHDYNLEESARLEEVIVNERRAVDLINAMNLGVWEYDVSASRVYWNSKVWWLMTGIARSGSWVSDGLMHWKNCVLECDLASMEASCARIPSLSKYNPHYARYRTKTNPTTWLIGYALPYKDNNGEVSRLVGHLELEETQIARNAGFEQMRGEKRGTYSARVEVNES